VGSSVSLVAPGEEKAHDRICQALESPSRDLFRSVPLDTRLLSEAQKRVHLASKIVACDEKETRVHKQNRWFQDAAEEAGLDIDDDLMEEGLAGGDLREQQQLHQAKRARADLRVLLSRPMTTRRFGKFLSTAAPVNQTVEPHVVPVEQQSKNKKKRKKRMRKRG